MSSTERQQQIIKILEKEGRVLAQDLAADLDVSLDSIEQDLLVMEEKSQLKRIEGGAVPAKQNNEKQQPSTTRLHKPTIYEEAIAEAAITFIEEGMTVFIGGGSMYEAMLSYLPKNVAFTVVTNSVDVAYALKGHGNIQLYLIGGKVKDSGAITDTLANEFAQLFTLDLSFATAGGISTKGLSEATPDQAIFHKMIYDQSKKIIALVDHSRFGINKFAGVYPVQYLDVIITDEETTEENVDEMKALGAKVIIAHNG